MGGGCHNALAAAFHKGMMASVLYSSLGDLTTPSSLATHTQELEEAERQLPD